MKKITILFYFVSIIGYSQTPITDANFQTAISTCLSTNPIDGMCSNSEFGAMPDWDVSNVTNMSQAFKYKSTFNANISSWNVSAVTNMNQIFTGAEGFNQYIGDWDVSKVTDMWEMFSDARVFNQDLNNWNVSNVTNMSWMFWKAEGFNQMIGSWDVSKVTDMSYMFFRATAFNQYIGDWDVSSVTNMYHMFADYTDNAPHTKFNQDISAWDVSNVTNMSRMFMWAFDFNQNLSSWDVGKVTDMSFMFYDTALNQNLGNWNISNVTAMNGMLSLTALSTDNYDFTLLGWSTKTLQQNVQLDSDELTYCNNAVERQSIIDTFGWIINDDKLDCATAGVYTQIPDPNFEQALINLGIDTNTTIDGVVLTANISGITTLNVISKNITDLTGIEGFTALTNLVCAGNQLTSLDLSNNAALTLLTCGGNQLTSLDVSNNTDLIMVQVYSNLLTSIDVSNNTALTTLNCDRNQITSLDLSNNAALTDLNCFQNQLVSLDLSNNTALRNLQCNNNQLVSIDVSNNTALTKLWFQDNQLTSLDVRNLNNTVSNGNFWATNNPNLTCILVDDAGWSTTNWTNIDATSTFVNNETECTSLSIADNILELGVSVYPNPTNSKLFIEGNETPISVSIYNVLGKEVISTKNTNNIDVKALPSGVYIIKISDGVRQTNRKFIKN